ncbi:MAG: hypothetical protein AABW56_05055 [Nanoarchaeota archaeon]
MEYFDKGKRGKIYLVKEIAIKKGLQVHINNEVRWLKVLNKYKIGPKLISYKNDCFRYKFVKGEFIINYSKKNSKIKIKKVLINVLKQCRILDKLKINKLELHNPYKHIIIGKKIVMIDFERCYKTDKPKNVSQFCQFLISNKFSWVLMDRTIKIDKRELINLVKKYKKNYYEKDFMKIIGYINKL